MNVRAQLASLLSCIGILACGVVATTVHAQATSNTWDNDADGNWTDTTNWVGNSAYAEGVDNTATLGDFITVDRIITLDAGITIGNITAADSSNNYAISPAASQILTLDRTAGTPIIDVTTSGRTLTIDSVVAGIDGLQKNGAGTLVLTNTSNTYSGTTTVTNGTLRISGSGTIGSGSYAGNISVTSGASINLNYNSSASQTFSGSVSSGNSNNTHLIVGSGTLTLSGSTDNSFLVANVTGGQLDLAKSVGGGVRALAGLSGVSAGALVRLTGNGGDQIFGGSAGTNFGVNNLAGTLDLNGRSEGVSNFSGSATGVVDNTAAGTATFTVGESNATSTFGGVIQNTGGALSLIKTGTGTQTFSKTHTYTGTSTIGAGTVVVTAGNAGGSAVWASGATTLNQGATLYFNPTAQAIQNTGGFTVTSPITLAGGAGTANLRFAGNDNKFVLSGGVTGQAGVAQTLAITQGVFNSNGDRMTTQFTGAIADGIGGTLGVSVDFAGGSSAAQRSYTNLSGPNTFTGNLTITNSQGLNGTGNNPGAWVTIGGLRHDGFSAPTLISVGTGYLGAGADYSGNISISNGSGGLTTLGFLTSANQILRGVISGTGSLHQGGTGTLTLTAANTYTGTTTVSGGIVRAGANGTATAGPFGNGNSSSVILANTAGAVLDLNNFNVFVKQLQGGGATGGNVTLGSGTLTLNDPASGSAIYGGIISGAGNLVVNGTSRQTLNGANTYTGTTTVNGSVSLRVSSLADGGLPSGIGQAGVAASNLVLNGGIFEYNSGTAGSTNRLFTLGTGPNIRIQTNGAGAMNFTGTGTIAHSTVGPKTLTLTTSGTGNGLMSPIISDSGTGANITSLTKTGANTWTLTGANTYSGGTTVSAGVLAVGENDGGVGGDTINPDGTSTSLGSGPVNVAAGAALHINTAGLTIANNITLNGLSYGVNSGGPTATNTGPWNGALMGASKTGVVSNTFSGIITLNATSNVSTNWNDKTMIITGKVTGPGGLTIDNSAPTARRGGLIRLDNVTNDYAGTTTINAGNTAGAQPTLILGASNVIPDGSGKGNLNVLGNLNLNSFSDTINGLTGSGVISNGVAATTSTLTVGNNNTTASYSGAINNGSGTVALAKTGSGTQTLTAASNFSGGTTISTGTIEANNNTALGSGSVSVAAGAKLFVNANSITLANNVTLNGATTNGAIYSGDRPAGNVTNLTGQITLNATTNVSSWWNDKTLRLSGKITGAGGLDFVLQPGAVGGRYFITGATNDYAGATSVTGNASSLGGYTGQAMLYLGATNALPTTTVLTLNNADLYLNGQSQILPSIAGSGTFAVKNGSTTAATLTLGAGDATSTFSGTIQDNGISVTNTAASPATVVGTVALNKTGNGILTLTGANTYSGVTSVNAGTLRVNGSNTGGGAYNVAAGATLGGTGSIGTSTFNIDGILAPGASIESLLGGVLNLNNLSTFAYELNSSVLNGDLVRANGGLNLTGTVTLTLTEEASGVLALGSKLTLVNYDSVGGWNNGTFTYLSNPLPDDSTFTLGSNIWQINYNDTVGGTNFVSDQTLNRFVTITVVPEPGSLMMLAFGVAGLWRFRGRRS